MVNVKDVSGEKSGIVTFTGRVVHPFNPKPETICIEDIAHGLSLTCRFSGQCRNFYSVAQHSLVVGNIVPRHLALVGLLHDAAEAYLTDIPRPFKQLIPGYQEVESNLLKTIFEALKIPFNGIPKEVKKADNIALALEQYELLPSTEYWPTILPVSEYLELVKKLGEQPYLTMEEVEMVFLDTYDELVETYND